MSISKLLKNEKMGIYGNGQNIRDWLYVEDHVKSLYVIMNNGQFGESYCIGGNSEFSNIALFKKIHSIIQSELNLSILPYEKSFDFVSDRLGHDFRNSISTKKIKNVFGIKFKTDMNEYIKKTIEFYRFNV